MKNKNKLYISNSITKSGDIIFDYINSIILVTSMSNTYALAIYQASQIIVSVIFNIYGGVIADKLNKKKILILGNFLSGSICLLSSFAFETKYYCKIFYSIVKNISVKKCAFR